MISNNTVKKKIIVSGAMIKYPWGGIIQWILAWLIGLKNLGNDVYYVEDVEWEYSCYDVSKKMMTSDPSYGISVVIPELKKYHLMDHFCFKDSNNKFYGMTKSRLLELFKTADIFIDLEFDTWKPYSEQIPLRVYVDPEPGWNQIGLQKMVNNGDQIPNYNTYFTHGLNIGTEKSSIPALGINWEKMFCPILLEERINGSSKQNSPFTTVMQWQANKTIEYNGKTYGMKDIEFQKFIRLPALVKDKMEIAVSGSDIPKDIMRNYGWIVKNADDISTSVPNYRKYIANSKGEFSIAKNAHVETNSGVFLERSGYYMFSKKPVVLQDTGWSEHLPTGRGLFAVKNLEEAVEAIKMINMDYKKHAKWANEIVYEYLDAEKVIGNFLQILEKKYL